MISFGAGSRSVAVGAPCGPGLGDAVHAALAAAGVTPARVERWLGRPCGCEERRQRLNQLDGWAARVLARGAGGAADFLARIMGEDQS